MVSGAALHGAQHDHLRQVLREGACYGKHQEQDRVGQEIDADGKHLREPPAQGDHERGLPAPPSSLGEGADVYRSPGASLCRATKADQSIFVRKRTRQANRSNPESHNAGFFCRFAMTIK